MQQQKKVKVLDDDSDGTRELSDSDNISEIDEQVLNNKKPKMRKQEEEEDSEIDEETASKISQEAKKNYITDRFKESVIKFIKLDDQIKQKMEEVKELKEQKKPFEEYIIQTLETADATHVNVKGGKLKKSVVESKAPLKSDLIKTALLEGIIKENITEDKERCLQIVEEMMNLMDEKRPIKTRVSIKRAFDRGEGQRKPRAKKEK
jgi:hypothetical protein